MNDYQEYLEPSLRDLAEMAGLNWQETDTALPQSWVDHVWEITEKLTGKGIYPYGFVWNYANSIWGEPIPLTDEAKKLAELIGVMPR